MQGWHINLWSILYFLGFPGGSAGKESIYNGGDLGSIPGLGRSPGEGKRLPTPVLRPGEFHGLYHPWGRKELDMTERLFFFWIVAVCFVIQGQALEIYFVLKMFLLLIDHPGRTATPPLGPTQPRVHGPSALQSIDGSSDEARPCWATSQSTRLIPIQPYCPHSIMSPRDFCHGKYSRQMLIFPLT